MQRDDKTPDKGDAKKEPNVLPPTEIAGNPEPRANENIRERSAQPDTQTQGSHSGINSEITDGEDA